MAARGGHVAACRLVLRERFIGEEELVFKFKQVRHVILVALFSDAALTAVAADKLTSAGEAVDGQTALIGAALAFGHGGRKGQRFDAVDR